MWQVIVVDYICAVIAPCLFGTIVILRNKLLKRCSNTPDGNDLKAGFGLQKLAAG